MCVCVCVCGCVCVCVCVCDVSICCVEKREGGMCVGGGVGCASGGFFILSLFFAILVGVIFMCPR